LFGTELDDLVKELVRLARQGYIGEVVELLDESIPDASVVLPRPHKFLPSTSSMEISAAEWAQFLED
jgi:hypothetical protein